MEKDNNENLNFNEDKINTVLPETLANNNCNLNIEDEVDSLCRWGAARAAAIVMVPFAGTVGLVANEIYMIKKIGDLHGQELSESVILGFIASLGASVIGSTLSTLIPYSPTKILIGAGVTFGVGRAAHEWIKAGRPENMCAFKQIFEQTKNEVSRNIKDIINNPKKDIPLGDETKKFDFNDFDNKKDENL